MDLRRLQSATQPRDRADARTNLDKAKAALASAEQNLSRLKAATHPQAVTNAQASLDKARSDLTSAEREVKRYKALYDKGFVSLSTAQDKENTRDSAQASFNTA